MAPDYLAQRLIINGQNLVDYINFELFKKLPERPFSIMSKEGLELARQLRQRQGAATLKELCEQVYKEQGVRVGLSSMSRALRRLNLATARRGPRPKELKRAA
jgi:transposase